MLKIRRALLSVSDKTGLVELAKKLSEFKVEIISTGGTLKALREAGLPVTPVSEVTGFPEILDGRVKTLHPYIHGGILARRDKKEHLDSLKQKGISLIDLVVVNLYPFQRVISEAGTTLEEAIENIDIGGPTMIRASAKNYHGVAIVTNPERYRDIIRELEEKDGALSLETRFSLAKEAFFHTAQYDLAISQYLEKLEEKMEFPEELVLAYQKVNDLRYGENPQQKAAFYRKKVVNQPCVTGAKQIQGKELSFNNLVDLESALEIVKEFNEPAVSIIKHTNPCGAACAGNIEEAYLKAYYADPVSAYGGIVGLNREVDKSLAEQMVKTFLEAVIAPSFTEEALAILAQKPNLRILETGILMENTEKEVEYKFLLGGLLIQDRDSMQLNNIKTVTKNCTSQNDLDDLLFAWKIVKHVKSNAIVLAKDKQTVGVGAGQMSRVESVRIAITKAGEKAKDSLLASDAFFPFPDGVELAAEGGVKAIIQPGGSGNDQLVIEAADKHALAMVFTGERHFKH